MTKIAACRDGSFFTQQRVKLYSLTMIAAQIALAVYWLVMFLRTGKGDPLGGDFVGFWAASWIELHHPFASLYDDDLLMAVEKPFLQNSDTYFCWLYPPTTGLLVLPLAWMPYGLSFLLWTGGQLAALWAVLRKIIGHPLALLAALAFQPLALSVTTGQNGLLSAALLGAGLLSLPKRPWLAGLLFAGLCYKPHLGLLILVALLAGRHWRALAGGIIGGAVIGAASLLLAGTEGWAAFLAHGAYARFVLEQGGAGWNKMVSVYAAVRSFGLSDAVAWPAQILAGLAAAALVARIWIGDGRYALKAAILLACMPLATPFLLFYDLTAAGLAIAWMVADGLERGLCPWDKLVLAVSWILPFAVFCFDQKTGLSLGPLIPIPLIWLIWRRFKDNPTAPPW